MNRRRLLIITTTLALLLYSPAAVRAAKKDPPPAQAYGARGHHTTEEGFYDERAVQNGRKMETGAYDVAAAQWQRLPSVVPNGPGAKRLTQPSLMVQPNLLPSINGTTWKAIGPSPIHEGSSEANGRVVAIAVNPFNSNVIYIGAAGGGVWKTVDGGTNWTPLFDDQASLGIGEPGSIAIDPGATNTIYVGTSGRFNLNLSKGIMKSTDGGASWIVLGSGYPAGNSGNADDLFSGNAVNRIIVDPANGSTLYAATSVGLYRSTNGGLDWALGSNGSGDAMSLVLDATSSSAARVLYAGVNGSGVRKSTDGGQTWTQVLNVLTPAVDALLSGTQDIGKAVVAFQPPNGLYATLQGTGPGAPDPIGVFGSTDGGTNWSTRLVGPGGLPGSQGGYDLELGVDPASPGDGANDILYFGAVTLWRSSNSGTSFSNVTNGQHVDFHAGFTFFKRPSQPSILLTGNDGGVWRSEDDGATWTGTGAGPATINAGGLQTALFYNLDILKDATASVTMGSLQDNGQPRSVGTIDWTDAEGGDGFDLAFGTDDPARALHTNGFWDSPSCTRGFVSSTSGASFGNVTDDDAGLVAELDCVTAQGLVHPVAFDPSDFNNIYIGGNPSLWRSSDFGGTFGQSANLGGRIEDINVAQTDGNYVVAAAGASSVWVSTNALGAFTFTNITRNLPTRRVTRVIFDPNDPSVIYATLTGFDSQTPGKPGHVFRTTVGGTSWTNISPALDVPYYAIALDGAATPSTIYAGTDLGVMRSVDGGASWARLDDPHLPNVPVTDLAVNQTAGVLRASTFGRGAFELAAAEGPVIAVNAQAGLAFGTVCSGTPGSLTLQVFNVGTDDLTIYSVQRVFGSSDFTVLPNPFTPLVIAPNGEVDFTVQFNPTIAGAQSATIRVASNDPAVPFYDLTATGTGGVGTIATAIADSGNFGNVCPGAFKDLDLTINNSGTCDLRVTGITLSGANASDFQLPGVSAFPITIAPGGSSHVAIRFAPSLPAGTKTATVNIASNDPVTPLKTVNVQGSTSTGDINVSGSTAFGNVCEGTIAEKTITVCNTGSCPLTVSAASILGGCTDFTIVNNPFPATMAPGSCLNVTVRFTPTSPGAKSCTLEIVSDDPDENPVDLTLTGTLPVPSIGVPDPVSFPPTVIQSVGACSTTKQFPISNTGSCPLVITDISITGNPAEYSLTGLPQLPIILQPGHVVGEGNFGIVFSPLELARGIEGTISITYVSDPVAYASNPADGLTTVTRDLCGEGVLSGARVLVTNGSGTPFANVEKVLIQRITGNRNRKIIDTIDTSLNLAPLTVSQTSPCSSFTYHKEYGTVDNALMLAPGSYQVTATVIVPGGKRRSKSVSFDISTCTFNPNVNVIFP